MLADSANHIAEEDALFSIVDPECGRHAEHRVCQRHFEAREIMDSRVQSYPRYRVFDAPHLGALDNRVDCFVG